ncbi:unnamed protein product, partial [Diplocarpon coronariae]
MSVLLGRGMGELQEQNKSTMYPIFQKGA